MSSSRPTDLTPFDWDTALLHVERSKYRIPTDGRTTAELCQSFLNVAVQAGCEIADAWALDPRGRRLLLITSESNGENHSRRPSAIDLDAGLTCQAVEAGKAVFLTNSKDLDNEFLAPATVEGLEKDSALLLLPVKNAGYPYQLLALISLRFAPNTPSPPISILESHACMLADTFQAHLRERAFRASMSVTKRLGSLVPLTRDAAFAAFAECICDVTQADVVFVLAQDWTKSRLEFRASTQPEVHVPDQFAFSETIVNVWQSNREHLVLHVSDEFSFLPDSMSGASAALAPLVDVAGRSVGVVGSIRALTQTGSAQPYTYEDVSLIDAMTQTFSYPFETLTNSEQFDHVIQKVLHELRMPIVAFRAVLERMEREYEASSFRFKLPHFHEAGVYTDIMRRLVRELDFIRRGPDEIRLNLAPTLLLSQVVMPAIRFVEPVLRARGFKSLQLSHHGFMDVPRLLVDEALITQTLFNLVENAIKYFPTDRMASEFRCRIVGKRRDGMAVIDVEDNGIGIAPEDEERVFECGQRGRDAIELDVQGCGMGLWISRSIAERHQGTLSLCRHESGTTLRLTIPIRR